MLYYSIFECTGTLELCEKARTAGFPAWVPIHMEKRIVDGVAKFYRKAALSGYIFIGYDRWSDFLRWVPESHHATVMVTRNEVGALQPATVRSYELREMDDLLRKMYARDLKPVSDTLPTPNFYVGQLVEVKLGPFSGLVGTVSRIRNGRVRVQLGARYVVMPAEFIAELGANRKI